MIAHRLTVVAVAVAVAVLCACALAVAGCDQEQSPGLHPITVDGKWGYIDKTGAVVVPVLLDSAAPFHDGLALVSTGGEVGYIDKTGEVVIEPRFKEAQAFSEGLAPVSLDGSKWGYIDKTGAWVVEPLYDEVRRFSEGLSPARQVFGTSSTKWGYIDTGGTYAIEQQFEFAWPFSEGLAAVGGAADQFVKFGYIDKDGRWKIELPLNVHVGEVSEFSDGLAVAEIMGEGYPFPTYGFIDKRGKWAIEPQFARASRFVEGLAAAAVVNVAFDPPPEHNPHYDKDADPKLLWGFIDKKGRWVIEPQYYSVQTFSEGIALVTTRVMLPEKDPKTGLTSKIVNAYVDKTGKVIWQEQ